MVKGEKRLRQIEGYVAEELRRISPKDADKYFVEAKPIKYPRSAMDVDYYSFNLMSRTLR